METQEYRLPSHWACYFINGDLTGYEESELAEIEGWELLHYPGPCVDVRDDVGFTWGGDDGPLGADRSTFVFQVIEEAFADGEVIGWY